jgi:Protein of unknown function (DUF3386)
MTVDNDRARDIFRTAYENRYTWDSNFPGYTTDLQLKQGEEVYHAKICVKGDLSFEITDVEDEKIRESLTHHMRDIVTHRKRSSFETTHGKSSFTMGETDATGAVEIFVKGESMGSNYRVRGQEICQVGRVVGPMAFAIDTTRSLDTGEGYISIAYKAIFRDSKTNELKGERGFQETYDKFGNYYLPTRQIIEAIDKDGQKTPIEFIFTNIKLLELAVV